ncbi:hypothetical protein N7508_011156 [Penicillium antarcticum]|uniref:uncharacterized protein n=1 Tax=Penicillium antarcticum TaxID=416450 RepID=UPI002387F112|nr:uncharacterized protein N7508_011156 [Penicillium antarcticum]KAJ5288381.1 hypothetical protein N7508_011156 [Penicillium antarcticum]
MTIRPKNIWKANSGAASATCTGFSLFETVLGADCGGKAVSLIDLDKTCGVDGSGKLSCGELTGTGSSTTSSAAESSSMAPISTEEATPASSGSKGSSVDSHSSTERTSGQSSNPGQNSASDVMTTTAAMSASTETAESCGVVEKRMRIMNR